MNTNRTWLWLAGFIILGVLLGVGVLFLVTRPPRGEAIQLLPAPTAAPLEVYVSGEVNAAGLYSLPAGSRINDAIQAAGGFTSQADASALNLAEFLVDGEQIAVPAIVFETGPLTDTRSTNMGGGLVNINAATVEQLDTLPGIGPVTAQSIIDYRKANGPFKTIEDIQKVSGIGPVTFDKIKDQISVGTSP